MKKGLFIVAVSFSALFLFSCSSQQTGIVVAEFGQEEITYNELKDAYKKNLSLEEKASADSVENLREFVDLYVNYRMKLRDAYVRGYQSDPELTEEIDDYTKTVGVPYVEERFIVEPGVKKLYERRKTEKRISHILIRKDTVDDATARKQAENLLKRIKNGESFEELAARYSQDEFSKKDSGDVYWLTAGQTVPEFDEAMYKTSAGEVYPEPIATKYGYHILKITDEQPRKYKLHARHILSSFNRGTRVDTAEAWETIQLVKQELADGKPFDSLAIKYSTDEGSARRGGDLGPFQRRMMVKPFDEAVFKLDVGEISDIVTTRFGYHIIQVTDIEDYPPYDKAKDELKNIYKRSIYLVDKEEYLNQLKEKYNFYVNQAVWDSVSMGNSKLVIGDTYWESEIEKEFGDSVLFSLNNNTFSVNDIMQELSENENYKIGKMTKPIMDKAFNEKEQEKLFLAKAYELRDGDTEFADLMEDYKNGLYIFEIQEDEIWNKVNIDTSEVKKLYEQNKEDYMWPEKVSYNVIYRQDSVSAAADLEKIQSGTPFEKIVDQNMKNPRLKNPTGVKDLQKASSNSIAQKAFQLDKPGDISELFKAADGWYIVKLIQKVPAEQKTFDEALTEVIGVWQEQETKKLEEKYLQRLKTTYEPEIYYDRLAEAANKKN